MLHRIFHKKVSWLAAGLLLFSCGGSSGPKPKAGPSSGSGSTASSGSSSSSQVSASGLPNWVVRSSGMHGSKSRRIFLGVGSAQGIKNPAMARLTSDNRARNELAKIFQTYSASLMKDYMSTEGQSIENAVKTFTAVSLKGSDIVDRYLDGQGVWYSLAMLDLEKVKAVQLAKDMGAVKVHVQKNADKIYDELNGMMKKKKPRPPAKPPKVAGTKEPPKRKPPKVKPAGDPDTTKKIKKGGKPAWVDGEDPNFPPRQYLCGVGYGPTRGISENGAFASLSKIFVSKVASVSKDFQASYSRTGSKGIEMQSIETYTQVSTAAVLKGVQIYELWEDKQKTIYTLACIKRVPAAASLREQIAEKDKKIERHIRKAKSDDALKKVKHLTRAMNTLMIREALNSQLRIIDPDGIGVTPPYSYADIEAALEAAVDKLSIGVQVVGSSASDIKAALIEGLTSAKWEVKAVPDADGDDDDDDDDDDDGSASFDILVHAKVRIEDASVGGNVKYARGNVDVQIKKAKSGKVVKSFNLSRREGHKTIQEASRRMVRWVKKELRFKIKQELNKYMMGKR